MKSSNGPTTGARRLRFAFVLAVVVVVNALALPNLWALSGTWGLVVDPSWTVNSVDPGSAAAKAGIEPNDRIDASTLSLRDRMALVTSASNFGLVMPPEYNVTLRWTHGGAVRSATLAALPVSTLFAIVPLVARFTAIVFTLIGALLVLMKPGLMTWGFFGYAVGATLGDPSALAGFPTPLFFTAEIALDIVAVAGTMGFFIFALRFPRDAIAGWRQSLERATPFLFVALALLAALIDIERLVRGRDDTALQLVFDSTTSAVITLGVASLLITYFQLTGESRQQIKWVASALVLSYAAQLAIIGMSQSYVPYTPFEEYGYVLRLLFLTVPLSVAYAVLHHRVIDVKFFISRALVYGLLTTLLVVIFTLLDLLFVKMFVGGKIALSAEIVAALALGFWLDRLHRSLDRIIDRLFFRQRYLAQRQLDRAAEALQHAQSIHTIDDSLIREAVDVFGLTSAALFLRSADGHFIRKSAVGWHPGTSRTLDHDNKIALSLSAEQAPLRVNEVNRDRAHLPQDALAPVIAIPVLLRRRLKAIVLYGPHANGADFDKDEIRSLNQLAHAASAAYDHLEAEALRHKVAEQGAELERMRAAATPTT